MSLLELLLMLVKKSFKYIYVFNYIKLRNFRFLKTLRYQTSECSFFEETLQCKGNSTFFFSLSDTKYFIVEVKFNIRECICAIDLFHFPITNARTHTRSNIHVHSHTHSKIYKYTFTHTHTHSLSHSQQTHALYRTHSYYSMYTHNLTHKHTQIHTPFLSHSFTQTHTLTHTHKSSFSLSHAQWFHLFEPLPSLSIFSELARSDYKVLTMWLMSLLSSSQLTRSEVNFINILLHRFYAHKCSTSISPKIL